ncbi:hypothetical protein PR048_029227 [Dryococelus australis]|uniref:Uncharacterized protein n=1 Tax=Dryococelus australis TaxID=614101 RepID=A0ABQ9GG13_9NEOP|nr:hypothetical protein PR048_029227 [Dryococelus australis]
MDRLDNKHATRLRIATPSLASAKRAPQKWHLFPCMLQNSSLEPLAPCDRFLVLLRRRPRLQLCTNLHNFAVDLCHTLSDAYALGAAGSFHVPVGSCYYFRPCVPTYGPAVRKFRPIFSGGRHKHASTIKSCWVEKEAIKEVCFRVCISPGSQMSVCEQHSKKISLSSLTAVQNMVRTPVKAYSVALVSGVDAPRSLRKSASRAAPKCRVYCSITGLINAPGWYLGFLYAESRPHDFRSRTEKRWSSDNLCRCWAAELLPCTLRKFERALPPHVRGALGSVLQLADTNLCLVAGWRILSVLLQDIGVAIVSWVVRMEQRRNAKAEGKREISEETRRPVASSGTIPTYGNPGVTAPGIEPGSSRWEASSLTTSPPRPLNQLAFPLYRRASTWYHILSETYTRGTDSRERQNAPLVTCPQRGNAADMQAIKASRNPNLGDEAPFSLGAAVTTRLPPKKTGFDSQRSRPRIIACGNRVGRCRWSAGFLGDLPFPLAFHSGAASHSPHLTLIGSQDLDVKSRPNLSITLTRFPSSLPSFYSHCLIDKLPFLIPDTLVQENVYLNLAIISSAIRGVVEDKFDVTMLRQLWPRSALSYEATNAWGQSVCSMSLFKLSVTIGHTDRAALRRTCANVSGVMSSSLVSRGVAYTVDLMWPHSQKSGGVMSGERGGHAMGPPLLSTGSGSACRGAGEPQWRHEVGPRPAETTLPHEPLKELPQSITATRPAGTVDTHAELRTGWLQCHVCKVAYPPLHIATAISGLTMYGLKGWPGFDFRTCYPDFGFPLFPETTPGECWDETLTKSMADSFSFFPRSLFSEQLASSLNYPAGCHVLGDLACGDAAGSIGDPPRVIDRHQFPRLAATVASPPPVLVRPWRGGAPLPFFSSTYSLAHGLRRVTDGWPAQLVESLLHLGGSLCPAPLPLPRRAGRTTCYCFPPPPPSSPR